MKLAPERTGSEVAKWVAEIGALPDAPLTMPKQRLEHPRGWLSALWRPAGDSAASLGRSGR